MVGDGSSRYFTFSTSTALCYAKTELFGWQSFYESQNCKILKLHSELLGVRFYLEIA
jgi:hypothetical protein